MKKKKLKLYLCSTDLAHELGECDVTVYESAERLKSMSACWRECGISRIDIKIVKTTVIRKEQRPRPTKAEIQKILKGMKKK